MILLLDNAAKISVILLVAFAAILLLRNHSAAIRHRVLSAAMFLAALMPVLTLLMPAWHVVPAAGLSAAIDTPPDLPNSSEPVVQPTATAPQSPAERKATSTGWSIQTIAGGIWLLGASLGVLGLLTGITRLALVSSYSRPVPVGRWTQLAETISREFGLRRLVRLLESPNSSMLVTWGLFRPKVLLPAGYRNWPEEYARVVLCHELAHIRRWDWHVQMAAEALRSIYWFNPLIWVACNRMRLESEYACDDAVLSQGIAGPEYAASLLDLARTLNNRGRSWSAALAMARPSTVERRFAAMLNPNLNRRPATRLATLAILIAAICVALPLSALQSAAPSQDVPGRLAGTVTDAAGAPVSRATIVVSTPDGRTQDTIAASPAGTYAFSGLPAGTYVLQVFAAGFSASPMMTVEMKAGQSSRQDLNIGVGLAQQIVNGTGSITGSVRDATGAVIPGVPVRITSSSTRAFQSTITDEAGTYYIGSMPTGTYRVTFAHPGFKTLNFDAITITDGQTTMHNASLDVGALFETVSVTAAGTPRPPLAANPDRPSPPARIRQGGYVQSANRIQYVSPVYPVEAQASGVQGTVVIEAVIGTEGGVQNLRVVAGHPLLTPAAVDAVSKWRYRPTLLNGEPVEVVTVFTINFGLGK